MTGIKKVTAVILVAMLCLTAFAGCKNETDTKVVLTTGFGRNEIFRIEGNEEIIDLLEKSNLLDIASTARGKERARKLPVQKGNSLRYLHLKKEEISKLFVE